MGWLFRCSPDPDLRRTGATRLSEMGYNEDWIEKTLNHKLRGVRGIYNRAEYGAQRREMLEAWANTLHLLQGHVRMIQESMKAAKTMSRDGA